MARVLLRRSLALLAAIVVGGPLAVVVATTPAAAAPPPTPVFGSWIEPHAPYDPQSICDPTAKPGVVAFMNLLNGAYGVRASEVNIWRTCGGGTSEHYEGRALDYFFDAGNSTERAYANEVISWLLATDQYGNQHARLRRLGIMYIIWNRQIWSTTTKSWRSYSCDGSPGDCHTNHIHFSFSWAGARKQTSWWAPTGRTGDSVTGDSYADLVARKTDGTLWLYANNFVRDGGVPYSAAQQIGSGWGGFNQIVNADVTGDGYTDLVVRKSADASLWLYSNNIVRDNGVPYSSGSARQIGSNWGGFNHLVGADVTGDGYADLVARKTDGTLWLYPNNIERDNGVPYSSGDARQIGSGWGGFNQIVGADVTGDGYTDLVARKTDGTLWLFPNNIERDNGVPYSSGDARQIGSGWGGFNQIVGADVTGDGYTDLVVRKSADASLWLYPNNIERDNGVPYSSPDARQIGSNWGGFNHIS